MFAEFAQNIYYFIMNNKNLFLLIIFILFFCVIAIVIILNNKADIIFYSNLSDFDIIVNNKKYYYENSKEPLEIKLSQGKYKIKATKENYTDFQKEIEIEKGKNYNIEINLSLSPDVKKILKEATEQIIKDIYLFNEPGVKYSIGVCEIENNLAKIEVKPVNYLIQPITILLKKENNYWKKEMPKEEIYCLFPPIEEITEEVYEQNPLLKYLPFSQKKFAIFPYLDDKKETVYKIILRVPQDNTEQEKYFQRKIEALEWILSKGVDYKNLKIDWEKEYIPSPLFLEELEEEY